MRSQNLEAIAKLGSDRKTWKRSQNLEAIAKLGSDRKTWKRSQNLEESREKRE
ncbi:MAG: hypothetical protein QNJ08_14135 [Crocosphaera sp.]|nr:hypothetical protein [Crocosphaera sp.]